MPPRKVSNTEFASPGPPDDMRFLLNLRTDAVLVFGAWGACQRWGHRKVQSANLASDIMVRVHRKRIEGYFAASASREEKRSIQSPGHRLYHLNRLFRLHRVLQRT